jgi:hypothetical protein
MAPLGKPKRRIRVEPLPDAVPPRKETTPTPRREPTPERDPAPARRERAPA